MLARLLVKRGRTAEALAALEPLLREYPASADLLCIRGNCLAAAGNNVGVRRCLGCLPRARPNRAPRVCCSGAEGEDLCC